MAANSPAYQTLLDHTVDLRLAIQPDLITFSGHCLSEGLLSVNSEEEIRNIMLPEGERVAKLVELIQNKVLQSPRENYEKFMSILELDLRHYGAIIDKLKKTYLFRNGKFYFS